MGRWVDAFILAHPAGVGPPGPVGEAAASPTGAEVDSWSSTSGSHASVVVRSASADSVVVGRLSTLVARRAPRSPAPTLRWSEFAKFWTVSFPVVAYRAWRWWLDCDRVMAVVVLIGLGGHRPWVVGVTVEIGQLVSHDCFVLQRTSRRFVRVAGLDQQLRVSAQCIILDPSGRSRFPGLLFENAANLGSYCGLMFQTDKLRSLWLGLLTPHRSCWGSPPSVPRRCGRDAAGVDGDHPGDRPRGQALAEQGRDVVAGCRCRAGGCAGVGSDRGVGHAVTAADVCSSRGQASPPRSLSLTYVIRTGESCGPGRDR